MADQLYPMISAHRRFVCVASGLQSFVLLSIRVLFGWELFVSGRAHLQDVATMVDRFTKWGVPFPHVNVYVSAYTEMVGGLLLIFGIAARLISVPLCFNFVVAYLTASRKTMLALVGGPKRLDAVDDFFNDAAFNFLIASLVILAFGPGNASIDHLLSRTVFRRNPPSARET